MKILTFSSLFPNARQASHGIFVENRLRKLLAFDPGVAASVVAPVPWFPFRHRLFGSYAGFDFDLIDAHYFDPDGVAAMHLAAELGVPFVVTGRGTDLNLIPRYPGPRRLIVGVTRRAAHIITVAAALQDYLRAMGVPEEGMSVLRNGVDLEFFHPAADRDALRLRLDLGARPTLLSVGHLIERKGHHLVIEAMRALPDHALIIAGDGPEEAALRRLVEQWSLAERVRFAGRLSQERLRAHYQAADALVLASSREGWANVLLESMACGTPVVATPVDGTPEVVAAPAAGRLTPDRSADAVASTVDALFTALPERAATRRYAEGFSWDDTSRGQLEIFHRVLRH